MDNNPFADLIPQGDTRNDVPLPPIFGPGGYDKSHMDEYGQPTGNLPKPTTQGQNPFSDLVQASTGPSGQQQEPSWGETFTEAKQNLPGPMEYLKSQLTNPIEDIKGVGKLALGTAEYLTGGEPISNEKEAAAKFWRHYGNYFSQRGLKENISQDPTGVLTDVLAFGTPSKLLTRAPEAAAAEVPTIAGLKATGGGAIEAAKQSGVTFTRPFMEALDTRLRKVASDYGYRPNRHGVIKDVLKELDDMSVAPADFGRMHALRMDLNDAMAKGGNEAKIGYEMRGVLNKVFGDLGEGTPEQIRQVVEAPPGTNPVAVAQNFKQGLAEWSAAKKAEEIQRIFDKAGVSGFVWSQSGLANAIKTQFRNLYKNDRKLVRYTPEERTLIKDIAGGNLGDQALTLISKFAVRGPVSAGVGAVLGGGPVGQMVIAGVGELAKRAIDRRQVAKVERLQNYILNSPANGRLRAAIGDTMHAHLMQNPQGQSAIMRWIRAAGTKAAQPATRALAATIAQNAKRTDLYPRILQELSALKGITN